MEHRDLRVAAHIRACHCDRLGEVIGAFPTEHFGAVCDHVASGTMPDFSILRSLVSNGIRSTMLVAAMISSAGSE